MSDTTVHSDLNVEQWADDEFYEYVRKNRFQRYMGNSENNIIQTKFELTKEAGDAVTFALVTALSGDGVEDDATLEGNEEALGNYGCKVTIHQLRHGVVVGKYERIKTKVDLLKAARTMLKLWNMAKLRDLFIARLQSPVVDGLTTYAAATEAQKDAWVVANNPAAGNKRILCGAATSNLTTDHSAGLANIDGTADDLHQDIVRMIKRLVMAASPGIRPVVVGEDDERFVLFAGSIPFRDLEANMDTVLSNADYRGEKNHIFKGGDLKIGNVIVHEVPEIPSISGVGAGSIDVQPTFLCGAQALLLAWGQQMQVHTDKFDYGNKRGVAVEEIRGCKKASFNSKQHGVGTAYVSAVGD